MEEFNWKVLGELAYKTHRGLLGSAGLKLDTWEQLDPSIQEIWIQTSKTIVDIYVRGTFG